MRKETMLRLAYAITALAALILLYHFGVKPFEKAGLALYHRLVVRNLVHDKADVLDKDGFFLGLYRPELPYQFDRLYAVEDSLGVRVSVVSYYQAWGDGDEYSFKNDVNRSLARGGFVPLITWEPWVNAFPRYKNRRVDSSLALIASGEFDGYIRQWARDAVLFGKPFFVRPGHEMSNAWYSWSGAHGNSPALFKKFWRHVYGIFREEGARNAAFVWCPYASSDTVYYPGNDCVDWIGLDVFNFGSLSQDGMWMDFYTVTKLLYDAVKRYGKPVVVAEAGCAASGGNKNDWYRNLFHDLALGNFPLIKGLVLFDTPHGNTPAGLSVDLGFSSDETVFSEINKQELVSSVKIKEQRKGAKR
jgi:hypothetical protein